MNKHKMGARISRRAFIDQGSKGVLVSIMLPNILRATPGRAFARTLGGEMKLSDYYAFFEITELQLRDIIAQALYRGGDYCDVFFQYLLTNKIGLEDNAVNRAESDVDFGVGIRVLKGDQTGYSFTEDMSTKAIKLAARTAANIADLHQGIEPVSLQVRHHPNYYPIENPWEEVGIDRKIPYLQKINDRTFTLDKRIIKSQLSFIDETSYILFANSEGKMVYDYQPMSRISVSITAEQNSQREQNYFTLSSRQGIEFFSGENMRLLSEESVRRTLALFDAVKPEAGEMEVVLAAGSSGILLHEAIGHGMEADFNRKKISIYSDKMNKPIAEKFVTIVDDGTNLNMRGSINVDDEGNDTEKTYLVENGILRSYLHDRISANYYQVQTTGNGRRESFRHTPLPRMRNTYMLPGPHKKDEIIQSIKKGIYAESFTNGQVFIGAGDFTFYVKSGYLIENGKIGKAIKDVNIIGNGPKVLADISMVGDDFMMDQGGWVCGKNGQRVPVSLGLPTVKVAKITVGGVNS